MLVLVLALVNGAALDTPAEGRDNCAAKPRQRSTEMIHEQWQSYLESQPDDTVAGPPGLAWVRELAGVRFSGREARSFLQGYLTCDTARLQAGALAPTALCNLKGRVVMNGWCTPETDQDVLLVLHASLVDTLAEFLKPYLMFSRGTALTALSGHLLLAGLDLDDAAGGLVLDSRRRLFCLDDVGAARALWERHSHLSAGGWLAALTADGLPLVSAPVSETFLPQMLDLGELGAIDFEKGCYLGQEVVARAQHRGQVKRVLTRLTWHGASQPAPGDEITDGSGKAQGVVLQSAGQAAGEGPALAVLRAQAPDDLRRGDVDLRRVR